MLATTVSGSHRRDTSVSFLNKLFLVLSDTIGDASLPDEQHPGIAWSLLPLKMFRACEKTTNGGKGKYVSARNADRQYS